ncbi:MAG: alkaline phosphatase family protein [Acidobacteriota bacterium]|nr:alkaline phosphatase family protein [Acidobacteriota bacterium]
MNRWMRLALFASATASGLGSHGQIPEQYPRPLLHTPTDHPADRVLIVSIDGLRALDLARWVVARPQSTLAQLSRRGVTYTNAHVPWPDSAAGLLALATGGSPISTGILSSGGFDRALSHDQACITRGASLNLDVADLDVADPARAYDPAHGCSPVTPHELVKVNNIFDEVHASGGRTAWADELPAYADLLRGPSGTALDEVFVPDIKIRTKNQARAADQARTDAVIHWIAGRDSTGKSRMPVPRLFGMTLTGLDSAQRASLLSKREHSREASVESALEEVDGELGRVVAELTRDGLNDSTWIIVTAKHGCAPTDVPASRLIDPARIEAVATVAARGSLAHITTNSVAMVWLQHPAFTSAVLQAYRAKKTELGIGQIYTGERLALVMNTAAQDSRMPDLILEPRAGVIWSATDALHPRIHGGFSDDLTHVALLVSGRQLTGRIDKTPVPTTQIAPLVLRILGMEKRDLVALHQEHTPALPGIF